MAIFLMLAIPVGHDFITKNSVSTQAETFVSALHYARNQAALKSQTLTLAPELGNWSLGMILFVDGNNNYQHDESEPVLFHWKWHDISINWHGLYNYLRFTSTGLESALSGTFTLCPKQQINTVKGYRIIMNRLGRIRVEDNDETCDTSNLLH